MIGDLGFSYDKIDASPNDCQLYWRDKIQHEVCSTYGATRW